MKTVLPIKIIDPKELRKIILSMLLTFGKTINDNNVPVFKLSRMTVTSCLWEPLLILNYLPQKANPGISWDTKLDSNVCTVALAV